MTHNIQRTYPKTDARPHCGDRVRVTNNRGEDRIQQVRGSEINEPRDHFVYLRAMPRGAPTCVSIEDCELVEASTPRFDDFTVDE